MIFISKTTIPLQVDVVDLPRLYSRAMLLQLAITSKGLIVNYNISLARSSEYKVVFAKHQKYRNSIFVMRRISPDRFIVNSDAKSAATDSFILFQYYFYDWPVSIVGAKQNLFVTNIFDLICRIESSIRVVNDRFADI
jgi:hypothetical protein